MALSWLFGALFKRDDVDARTNDRDASRSARRAEPSVQVEPWEGADGLADGTHHDPHYRAEPDVADRLLAERLRAGDIDAFRRVFEHHYTELVAHAYRYVRRRAVAEELVQDVFLRVWARRTHLPDALRPRAYLYASVRNAALKVVRRDVLDTRVQQTPTDTDAETSSTDVLAALEQADTSAALARAIAALPPRLREVVELRWQRQLRIAEVASVLGVTPKAAETYVTRAVRALRTLLAGTEERTQG